MTQGVCTAVLDVIIPPTLPVIGPLVCCCQGGLRPPILLTGTPGGGLAAWRWRRLLANPPSHETCCRFGLLGRRISAARGLRVYTGSD